MRVRRAASLVCALTLYTAGLCVSAQAASSPEVRPFKELTDRKISAEGQNLLDASPDAWTHAESEYFVYHYTDAEAAQTVLFHAEAYIEWLRGLFGIKEIPAGPKIHVFIFNNAALWSEFRHRGTLERRPGVEAYTDGRELYIHRAQFWLEPQRVLAHELAHVMLYRLLGERLPLYLHEGFAEWVGYRAASLKFGGDESAVRQVSRVPSAHYVPMPKLAAMRIYPKGVDESRYFYLQSELFVRYLIETYGAVRFYEFLRSTAQSKSLAYSLHQVYQISEHEVDEAFRAYAIDKSIIDSD